MKKYTSNIFAILISGALIISTVFISSFGSADTEMLSVEEHKIAKSTAYKIDKEIPVDQINVNKIFGRFTEEGQKKPDGKTDGTQPDVISNSTSSTSSVQDSSTTNANTSNKTEEAKIPADESKNIEYIKDPNYKSPYYIVVYTGSQSAVVYGKDETGAYNMLIKSFTVSTGRKGSPTRKGVYKIRAKYRWRSLNGDCFGQWCSSISPDYLFHSVPYSERTPSSLFNASYNNLGKPVSHGCIRMCVRDVKWIYDNCPIGTQVHVVWESGPKGAGVPRRKTGVKYRGWDPSDQWSKGNPYFKDVSTTESEANPTGKLVSTTSAFVSSSTASTTGSTKPSDPAKPTGTVKTTSESTDPSQTSATSSSSESDEKTDSTQKTAASSTQTSESTTEDNPDDSSQELIAVG